VYSRSRQEKRTKRKYPGYRNSRDIVCVAIKKYLPSCQLDRKKVYNALLSARNFPVRRSDGSYVRFDTNAAVINDAEKESDWNTYFRVRCRESCVTRTL
jgi:large subunit ribosomal protein L14